jgi:predicted permease
MLTRLVRRVRYWLNRSERERLLREEIEAHIEMAAQQLEEEGMSEHDAGAAARLRFGNMLRKQEDSRETWIARWLTDLMQDFRFALRTIRRQPAFATVAAVSAALGIGSCCLMFALANYALFHPLPVEDPSRLMGISGKRLGGGKVGISIAYPDFEDLRKAQSFRGMAAFFQFMPATIAANGEPQRYWGSIVSANYFDVVRPHFVAGRGFDPRTDDIPGAPPVVVLSHQLWRSRFAGDHNIVGRTVELNGRKVNVVGITAPGFRGTELMFFSDFWIPLSMLNSLAQVGMGGDRLHDRGGQWLLAVGRLRDSVTTAAAAAEIETIARRLSQAYPATNKERTFHIERAGQVTPGLRKMVLVLFSMLLGVAALVLSTACANVANLLLARASSRQKEIATRLAIGAGRFRLVRQLLTESLILALLGGIGGYALAQAGLNLLSGSRIPLSMPVDFSIALDYKVMLFCITLSTLTGLVFGLVPALRATRPGLVGALKDDKGWIGQSRRFGMRHMLVVAQVTICTVLLICSGLFLRSLDSARTIDPGFTHRDLLLMAFDPSLNGYSPSQTGRIVNEILEEARGIPGVESAALSSSIPLNLEGTQNAFVPDRPLGAPAANPLTADIYSVAPGFFHTLGIAMIDGEDFRAGVRGDDIVIVNQALAAKAFPGENPIGRRISYMGRTVRITGVAATHKSRTIGEDPRPCLYFPMARDMRGNDSLTGMTLILRTSGNPAAYAPLVRQGIRKVDPTLAIFDVRTMETQLTQALFLPRAAASLFGLAGFMGLLIATVGIYGVISFAVSRMTKEIGVRMALGATRTQVLGMVLRQGLVLALAGSAVGLGLALALGRVTASLLYGVSPTDNVTFALVPALLLSIALIACLVPAKRAASLDPLGALRYE